MTKRYFKATDGTYTIFRASDSRVYRGAWMRIDRATERSADGETWVPVGEPFPVDMGFSAKLHMPILKSATGAPLPAVEIDKAEYDFLVQIKTDRIEARRDELRKSVGQERFGSVSPRDSWVRNAELEVTP